jgi:hypothetical protein
MATKFELIAVYIGNRLAEPGTWQGIGFFVGLISAHYATMDWTQAAAIGGSVSGLLKIIFPDAAKIEEQKS